MGGRSIPRLKYRPGEIWLMSPLPEHGRNAHLVSMVITSILDFLEQEYEALSTPRLGMANGRLEMARQPSRTDLLRNRHPRPREPRHPSRSNLCIS